MGQARQNYIKISVQKSHGQTLLLCHSMTTTHRSNVQQAAPNLVPMLPAMGFHRAAIGCLACYVERISNLGDPQLTIDNPSTTRLPLRDVCSRPSTVVIHRV